ncbi:MAG: hypothetical protein U0V87_13525 [Acidobacteriota bacterium]
MKDRRDSRRAADAFFARQHREIAKQIELEHQLDAFLARQQREIMTRIADDNESQPFFERQAEELRHRIAAESRRDGFRRLALTVAAACLLCVIGLGAWKTTAPPLQSSRVADAWLSEWPIPGVDDIGDDPLGPFGEWEESPTREDEALPFDDPLLPPSDELSRLSEPYSVDDSLDAQSRS